MSPALDNETYVKMNGLAARLYYSAETLPGELYHARSRPEPAASNLHRTSKLRSCWRRRPIASPPYAGASTCLHNRWGESSEQLTGNAVLRLTAHPSGRMFSTGSQANLVAAAAALLRR